MKDHFVISLNRVGAKKSSRMETIIKDNSHKASLMEKGLTFGLQEKSTRATLSRE